MKIDKSTFQSLIAMFKAHEERGGRDEIEAVYTEGDTTTRETALRLISYLRGTGARSLGVHNTLDVQMEATGKLGLGGGGGGGGGGGFGGGGVTRVTIAGDAAIKDALGADKWDTPMTTVIRKYRLRSAVTVAEYRLRLNLKAEDRVADASTVFRTLPTVPGKTFRLKRRFSYSTDDGWFRVDVTGVRTFSAGAAVPRYEQLDAQGERYELELEYIGGSGSGSGSSGNGSDSDGDAKAAGAKKKKKKGGGGGPPPPTPEEAARALLKHFSVLLKVVDDTDVLLSPSEKRDVALEYVALAWDGARGELPSDPKQRSRLFVGPKPVTLEMCHVLPPGTPGMPFSVREGYTVTEKADGERRLLFVAKDKSVYTINDRLDVRATGLSTKTTASCILDGEAIEGGRFMCFDAYFINGTNVRSLPLYRRPSSSSSSSSASEKRKGGGGGGGGTVTSRLDAARAVASDIEPHDDEEEEGGATVAVKEFLPIKDGNDLFLTAKRLLAKRNAGNYPYEVDGLIYTPMSLAVGATEPGEQARSGGGAWPQTLKWKPPHQNTIDFVVRMKPEDTVVVRALKKGGTKVACRVAELMVGYDPNKSDAVTAMDFLTGEAEARMMAAGKERGQRSTFQERAFAVPGARPDVHVAYLPRGAHGGSRCANGDEIVDGAVVEFAYDKEDANWRPLRVRHDKATSAPGGTPMANSIGTALSVWRSIENPVTEAIITGAEAIDEEAAARIADVYYVKKTKPRDRKPMQRFHNWIKRDLLLLRFRGTRSIFDIGVGRAGDLQKWIELGAERVVGIDKFASNLTDPEDGAYARVLKTRREALLNNRGAATPHGIPRVAFVPFDATQVVGKASIDAMDNTRGDRDIAQVLWGLVPPTSFPRLRPYHRFAMGGFDLCTCMFAVHYFFGSAEHLRNLARNVAQSLRPGGFFAGVCLDGVRVDELLAEEETAEGHNPENGKLMWSITKRYEGRAFRRRRAEEDADADADGGVVWDRVGREVDVYMDTIGQTLPEYLVDYRLLVAAMGEVQMRPLPSDQCAKMGFGQDSTGTFDAAFDGMAKLPLSQRQEVPDIVKGLQMGDDEKRYSFLNRWFVFVKASS